MRKFATKIAPQQNGVNVYFEILFHISVIFVLFAYYFDGDSILGVLFGVLGVFIL